MIHWKTRTALGSLVLASVAFGCTAILGDLPQANVIDGLPDATNGDASHQDGSASDASNPDTSTDAAQPDATGDDGGPAVDAGVDSAVADAASACDSGTIQCNGSCVDPTTNTNCGGCGLACPTGCNAGECLVTLAPNIPKATGIVINAIKAYVTSNQANGDIYAMSLSGGGATNLTPSFHQAEPFGIAVDNANVYWTNYGNGAVMKMPIGGQVAPTQIAANQTAASTIVLDPTGQTLYWTAAGNPGSVQRYVLATSTLSTLIGGINVPVGLAVNATHAYVALESDDYVIKVLLSNGSVAAQLTGFQNNPYALAIDGTNVYFTNYATGGDVRQVAQNASMSTGITLGATAFPSGIATDGVNVYWAGNNAIYKCPVGQANGGKVFVPSQGGAASVAVDGTSLYWTNSTAGTVMKITPK